ncbi:hypothetical protein TVAG_233010 [Trichomonas vaginalis G3]|uniref:Uncharacterized protein n=1 Tax=Trichomonas vaginalis (strain ATCC PRA-98 / G3) TaxID=412133 RepID=A2ERX0_TRIV3|nr:5-carbamoylmethyl uridine residue modification protein [Trichomonas vaginalis G3]EAY04565.1 hypothetical protein TVAG_233010 [Trichomonas vaginalis G3]KAI5516064.1 5-carbamoylmethyl uridine residue modification protein [Trichomonas vaginalis G3]|eukprot:XP_001316788.1 hypothetical protein [Trichomonas vaginalis G3]
MSLILLVGVPGSGKTTLANNLKKKFDEMKQDCAIVTEKGVEAGTFDSSNNERLGRSDFKAAVGRMLSLERVVICDGMNFIKGFRYEIFCLARENHLRWCVAFCDVDDETAFNRSKEKYPNEKRLRKLIGRMEKPSTKIKFDNPLIVVNDVNDENTIDSIIKAAYNNNAKLIPKKATTSCAETAHYNDKVDQLINQFCQELEKMQATTPTGIPITICGATFTPKKKFTAGHLKKARREFASRAKSLSEEQNVVQIFADSLEVIH